MADEAKAEWEGVFPAPENMGVLRSEEEFDLFWTVFIDERPFNEVREQWVIPSKPALQKRRSRGRKNYRFRS